MARINKTFLSAILRDARLLEESVVVNEESVKAARKHASGPLKTISPSQITNEVKLGRRNESAPGTHEHVMLVDATLTVEVRSNDSDAPLVSYKSHWQAVFEIVPYSDVVDGSEPPQLGAVWPYLQQVNWMATRRADQTIGETGIVRLRLDVPDVGKGADLDKRLDAKPKSAEASKPKTGRGPRTARNRQG